jgi:hypothetical protein
MVDLSEALDLLIDDVDRHIEDGDLEAINLFLEQVSVSGAHHALLICALASTLVVSELLPARSSFYHRVEEEFLLTKSEQDTQAILKRLR